MDTLATTTRWEACCPHCAGDVLEVADRAPFLVCVDCGWPLAARGRPRLGRSVPAAPTTLRPGGGWLSRLLVRLGVFALGRGQVQ